jgi:hypothetical protein
MDKDDLLKRAKDPEYIPGIYNYCDRWCERCQFTSRCLNCDLVEEQFGELRENDEINEAFWRRFSEMLQNTMSMVKEMAKEAGMDIDAIDIEDSGNDSDAIEESTLPDLISHTSKNYGKSVDDWFNANVFLFYEKEDEMNRIRLISSQHHPAKEAADINDATEVIRWYQYQIHIKLSRAIRSASEEESMDYDDFPKDSDGSAKVALIGIDRSISAWNMLLAYFPGQKTQMLNFIALLENIKSRVEVRFPCARDFVRPGFDEVNLVH